MKLNKSLALLGLSALLAAPALASEGGFRTIDLTSYCNFGLTNSLVGPLDGPHNLSALPAGVKPFASVPFDVSGIIQLRSQRALTAGRALPEKVSGIKIEANGARIHVLHGAGWSELADTTIATLTVNYADGEKREIPIIYGKHVCDLLDNEENPSDASTSVAWTGVNPVAKAVGSDLRVYKTTFENPKPAAKIASVDFASNQKEAAPFLLGLTIE